MKYFVATLAFLILVFIFSEAGYFYIEYCHEHINWDEQTNYNRKNIYTNNSTQAYIGLNSERLDDFDSKLKGQGKVKEVVEFKDSSDYYGLFSKTINMHLLIRDAKDTTEKYSVKIGGSFDGICSPQGARERLMLMLRQIEYNKAPQ